MHRVPRAVKRNKVLQRGKSNILSTSYLASVNYDEIKLKLRGVDSERLVFPHRKYVGGVQSMF